MRKKMNLFMFTCFLLIQTLHSNRYPQEAPLDDEDFNLTGSGDGPDDHEGLIGFATSNTWNVTTAIPDRFKVNVPNTRWPLYSYHFVTTPSLLSSYSYSSRSQEMVSSVTPSTTINSPVRSQWQGYYDYQSINNSDLVSIRVYPTSQIIYATQEVVIRCRDESYHRLPVIWSRSGGKPMSHAAIDKSGRLIIPNITLSDAGEYKCSPIDQSYRYLYSNTSKVIVYPIESLRSQQIIPSHELFQCPSSNLLVCPGSTNCIPKTYFCDGEPDCPGGRDEDICEFCKLYEFRCRNGQCIDKARRCDGSSDCRDESDEYDCNDSKSNVLPLQLSIVPPYMDVERGAFVQFACASSDPNARLAWVFEQGELPRTATVLGGTLTIRNAQEMDQGTYICMGTDPYGTKAEAQARLTVRRPQSMVTVNIVPRYIEVEEGGNVVLTCNSSLITNNYSWSFNRGVIPPGAEIFNNNQLRIRSANQRHSGHYMCNVRTQYGVGDAIALVAINPVSSERRPAMLVQPSHKEVPLGESVRFLCNATDPRPNQIIWQFRRGQLPPGAVQSRELLTISSVTEAHYGEYHCLVSNSFGRNQQTVELHRPGGVSQAAQNQPLPSSIGPNIDIQPAGGLNVEIGDYARLECRSNEVEPDDIQWLSSSRGLPKGATSDKGVLVIPSVTEVHYGIYTCEATNSYGTSRKNVEIRRPSLSPNISPSYRPVTDSIDAIIEPQQQTIVQGNSGILRCMVTGVPSPSIIWSKVNGVLTERHRIDGEIMRIENAIITDRGLYVCKVESPPGTVVAQGSAIVEIEPREPPIVEIYPSVAQSIPIGGSALFQCRIIAGIPEPKIYWTRADNSPLTSNTETVEGGVIRFLRVTGSEEGIYKCTAENIAGRVEYEVTLRIERSETALAPVKPARPSEPIYDTGRSDSPRLSSKVSIKINQRSPLMIKEGEPLMLDCITEGSMDAQVIWMKVQKGQYITKTAIRRNFYQKYDPTSEDSGEYRCIAHSSSGTVEERIQVIVEPVTGLPHIPAHRYPQPALHINPYESTRNVTLGAGGSAEIKCHASGSGLVSPVMNWTRESGSLPANAYQRDGTLYIERITADNSGTYTCTGRGPVGEVVAIQRVLLNVRSKLLALHLDPVSQVVSVGQRVSVKCILPGVTGDLAKITWNREGFAMSPNTRIIGGQLIFIEISLADTGSYICRAITSEGEARAVAHIQVISGAEDSHSYRPSPTQASYTPSQYPTNYETRPPQGKREIVDQMSTKTLSCDFRRIPDHVIRWEFNNMKTLPPNAIPYGNDIVLSNIDKNNEGRYICNAQLPGSERPIDRDFIDLIVRDTRQSYNRPPDTRSRYPSDPFVNYPTYSAQPAYPEGYPDPRYQPQQPVKIDVKIEPNKLLVTVGGDLELRCHADGPDYQYEWFKDGQSVRGENIEMNHNVLIIKNIKSENGGVYTCRARNRYGFGTDDHVVMIQRASPQDEIRIVEADRSSSVSLGCTQPNQQCQNKGICQAEICVCPVDFMGPRCETSINQTRANDDTGITSNNTLTKPSPSLEIAATHNLQVTTAQPELNITVTTTEAEQPNPEYS